MTSTHVLMIAATLATAATASAQAPPPQEIVCDGVYEMHVQGTATDGEAVYWSFTNALVKTDMAGQVLAKVAVPYHHGDLCCANDKVYVACSNYYNRPGADSRVYVYAAEDLALLEIVPVPEAIYGAGGVEYLDGHFFVVTGLPQTETCNYICEYDEQFAHVKTHVIASGYTQLGVQAVCFHDDAWWLGCYGNPGLIRLDRDFQVTGQWKLSSAYGMIPAGEGRVLVAKHFGEKWQAKLVPARLDAELGLVFD